MYKFEILPAQYSSTKLKLVPAQDPSSGIVKTKIVPAWGHEVVNISSCKLKLCIVSH